MWKITSINKEVKLGNNLTDRTGIYTGMMTAELKAERSRTADCGTEGGAFKGGAFERRPLSEDGSSAGREREGG